MSDKVARKMARFPEVLEMNAGNIKQTCDKLGVSRSTYAKAYKTDKEFKLLCDNVQEGLVDLAESKALELIKDKNTAMIIFFLKTKGKHRGYVERTEVDERGQREVRIVVKE